MYVNDFVKATEFQDYWQHANEDIQSSESGIHFGHYKAVAIDKYLSSLEAPMLTLASKTGVPIERWGRGLVVLLEKLYDNMFMIR